jgi:hypothetical protein
MQIADLEAQTVTFAGLLAFSESMLANIADAWTLAGVGHKQRVQNALFPEGVLFDLINGILNPSKDCLSTSWRV